jgi:pyruvate/2-oxoglutarate dehydrogenase complex dihydrolipoamide acyltransferase (E2) component
MIVEVKVPNFAEGASKIKLRQWLVEEGQAVKVGENIAEAATDKISIFIEAPASGYIVNLIAHENDTVFIGDIIAEILGE